MAANKISKEDLGTILKSIISKSDFDSMQEAVERAADEYGIDLADVEEEDADFDLFKDELIIDDDFEYDEDEF